MSESARHTLTNVKYYTCHNNNCNRYTLEQYAYCCMGCAQASLSGHIPRHDIQCSIFAVPKFTRSIRNEYSVQNILEAKFFTVVLGSNDSQYVIFDDIDSAIKFFDLCVLAKTKNFSNTSLYAWTGELENSDSTSVMIKRWTYTK